MRILANFSKKVSTGDYENETFTVSMECETEFNNVAEVADYLFQEARDSVVRQLNGESAANGKPATTLPNSGNGDSGSKRSIPACLRNNGAADQSKGNGKMTDSQRRYLFRLLAERGIEGDQANKALLEHFSVSNLKEATKSDASKLIEELVNSNQ